MVDENSLIWRKFLAKHLVDLFISTSLRNNPLVGVLVHEMPHPSEAHSRGGSTKLAYTENCVFILVIIHPLCALVGAGSL